ncbi:MAG: hypothetical protein ACI9YH_002334 [Colwellia sp.]|jgi:hypothetical protein
MLFRLLTSFIILCLLTFSTVYSYAAPFQEEAEDKPTEPKKVAIIKRPEIFAPVDALKQKEQDLSHYLMAEKVVPMLAGAKDFITIINENIASNQKGVMILLPDWEMMATSSNALNYLQKMLPSQGWTTITIQPPGRPIGYPSSALNLTQQIEENEKLLAQCQENITAMMTAVMEKAKDYPGIFVVVSKGSHAILLANLYSNRTLEPPSALVMLSGYMNTGADSLSFAKTLATSEFPVLDLFLSRDHQLATMDSKIRKAQATKEMKVYYRQTQLHNNEIGFYPEKKLLRSINGWLKSIGW